MTVQDQVITALTAWREQRGAGVAGLQSIINVIMNRAARYKDSPYTVCTQHAQFSSISMAGPESFLWPVEADPQWQIALDLTAKAAARALQDLTGGSTLYYAPASIANPSSIELPNGSTVPFPRGWNASVVKYQTTIGGQLFFTQG